MSYSRVNDNEFKPRVLRRYVNNSNLTFKSDLMSDIMSPQKTNKAKNVPPRQPQQLDIALKSFERREQPKNNPQKMVESALVRNEKIGDYLSSYDRILAQEHLPRRSVSQVVLKQYIGNDEGIFVKQSKPYNIISNYPREILPLRQFDKKNEYKMGTATNLRPPTD